MALADVDSLALMWKSSFEVMNIENSNNSKCFVIVNNVDEERNTEPHFTSWKSYLWNHESKREIWFHNEQGLYTRGISFINEKYAIIAIFKFHLDFKNSIEFSVFCVLFDVSAVYLLEYMLSCIFASNSIENHHKISTFWNCWKWKTRRADEMKQFALQC